MTNETMKAYAEIDCILSHMPEEYVLKVPLKLREKFKIEKDSTYQFELYSGKHLSDYNLSKKTKLLLAMLKYNYWCKNEEEKQNLLLMFKQNEDEYQKILNQRYNSDNIFKNRNKNSNIDVSENGIAMVEYKESIITKIFNKKKKLFSKF